MMRAARPGPRRARPRGANLSRWKRQRCSRRDFHHVFSRGALLALHDVELHAIAFSERLVAAALNRRVVDEAIFFAALTRDEAETLLIVEPLHCTGRTHSKLLMMCCVEVAVLPYQ